MWSKALCLGVAEPTTWLAAQGKAYDLYHRLGKQAYVKEKEKSISVKEICKILEIYRWILFPTWNVLVENIKPATVVKLDQICQIFFFFLSVYDISKILVLAIFD